jgi:hypothetical protein
VRRLLRIVAHDDPGPSDGVFAQFHAASRKTEAAGGVNRRTALGGKSPIVPSGGIPAGIGSRPFPIVDITGCF